MITVRISLETMLHPLSMYEIPDKLVGQAVTKDYCRVFLDSADLALIRISYLDLDHGVQGLSYILTAPVSRLSLSFLFEGAVAVLVLDAQLVIFVASTGSNA
ncbi:hypothetical protein EV421DRAFT_1912314 [Armillaria borealis]|uniref:Uncharacterized protein n=1 Tax=Armillaria borealis TaxID=47425 RepID=A0AA39IWU9_9AGAR|nr:hypothetical protein EV421DRAFT_1912314 [Armillaria borealis]